MRQPLTIMAFFSTVSNQGLVVSIKLIGTSRIASDEATCFIPAEKFRNNLIVTLENDHCKIGLNNQSKYCFSFLSVFYLFAF